MPMQMKVKITRKKDMKELSDEIKQEISHIMMAAGYMIEIDAKEICPVNTGRLRASIHTELLDWNKVKVGTNVEYAAAVEYGTVPHFPPVKPLKRWAKLHGMPESAAWAIAQKIAKHGTQPQPYMRPAFLKNKSKIRRMIRRKIKELLRT